MLLQSVLYHLRAMSYSAEVAVDPLDQAVAAVAEFLPHRVDGHRRALIECLKPSRGTWEGVWPLAVEVDGRVPTPMGPRTSLRYCLIRNSFRPQGFYPENFPFRMVSGLRWLGSRGGIQGTGEGLPGSVLS